MKRILRQFLAISVAGVAFATVVSVQNPNAASAKGIKVVGMACVPDVKDSWLPSWCYTKPNIDACAGTVVSLHRVLCRKCALALGSCASVNPAPVTVLLYKANCVWSASGCVIDAVGNLVSWSPNGSRTVMGSTCTGTMKGNTPPLPKVCEGCTY